jgi:HAD superfamily hydrolase (TIGR01484 family)
MRYLALCCDYDGTLAHHGVLDDHIIAALERLKESGRHLIMVTGRELEELKTVCSRLDLFERVVAENGALIYRPETKEVRLLAEAPPERFVQTLKVRGVDPIAVGRVIVATWEPHENVVLETIRDLGLDLQVIFNKGAVMILPAGVNKATGLRAALEELNLSARNAVAVGDAENDHAFFSICECSVAVANALPSVKEKADIVTEGDHGKGVAELIDEMIEDDLFSREPMLLRHHIVLGQDERGRSVTFSPYGVNALIVGTSGGGKSTVAVGLVERLREKGYSFCIIDPEGDYDNVESAVVLGNADHPPAIDECIQLLCKPDTNAVINLLGLKLNDRPRFFMSLFLRLRDLRAQTGRPHWIIVDEAHHVAPANWQPADISLPQTLEGVLMVSVSPSLIAAPVLRAVDTLVMLGDKPREMLREFTDALGREPMQIAHSTVEPGSALLWNKNVSTPPLLVRLEPSRTERRRHLRKYAEGELPPDRSFFFRGPEGKLKLRAQNLIQFLELGDGVDDDTWLFHLRNGDAEEWMRRAIKDEALAEKVAAVAREEGLDAETSRQKIREIVEAVYTLPATSKPADDAVVSERTG